MQVKSTNFEGDWDAACPFCGRSHRHHQVDVGEHEGVRYVHRMPCAEQQRHITKEKMKQAAAIRLIVSVYEVGAYIWSKIPFKQEARLVFRILTRLYVTVRGVAYYLFSYRRKP